MQPGTISLSDPQRTWCDIGLMDRITGELYDPFSQGPYYDVGALDIEVGFASQKKVTETPFDQRYTGRNFQPDL